jgi:hypothetical protein
MGRSETREEVVCLSALMVVLAAAAWNAQTFPDRARVFPQLISLVALVLCSIELVRQLAASRARPDALDGEGARVPHTWLAQLRLGAPYLWWIGALYAGIYFVGFLPASFLFLTLFLRRVSSMTWGRSLASSALLATVLIAFGRFLHMVWPEGLLQLLLGLG